MSHATCSHFVRMRDETYIAFGTISCPHRVQKSSTMQQCYATSCDEKIGGKFYLVGL
jgi:hypothetical protein